MCGCQFRQAYGSDGGDDVPVDDGPIPAHCFGSVLAGCHVFEPVSKELPHRLCFGGQVTALLNVCFRFVESADHIVLVLPGDDFPASFPVAWWEFDRRAPQVVRTAAVDTALAFRPHFGTSELVAAGCVPAHT